MNTFITEKTLKAERDQMMKDIGVSLRSKYTIIKKHIGSFASRFEFNVNDERMFVDVFVEADHVRLHIHTNKPSRGHALEKKLKVTIETATDKIVDLIDDFARTL
jgi:hypothetical protein